MWDSAAPSCDSPWRSRRPFLYLDYDHRLVVLQDRPHGRERRPSPMLRRAPTHTSPAGISYETFHCLLVSTVGRCATARSQVIVTIRFQRCKLNEKLQGGDHPTERPGHCPLTSHSNSRGNCCVAT